MFTIRIEKEEKWSRKEDERGGGGRLPFATQLKVEREGEEEEEKRATQLL